MNEISRVGAYYLRGFKGRSQLYICWTDQGEPRKVSTKTSNVEKATAKLAEFAIRREHGKRVVSATPIEWLDLIGGILTSKEIQARKRKLPFDLDEQYVLNLMHASQYRCPISGIPFQWCSDAVLSRGPWGPSIDRIDNRQGYIRGNVRVVCLAANIAMNAWGYDVLLRLASGVMANHFHSVEPGLLASFSPVSVSRETEN